MIFVFLVLLFLCIAVCFSKNKNLQPLETSNQHYEVLKTDVLVIGGGAAACMAAVSATNEGMDVLVLDKGQLGKSGCFPNTHGGMAIYHKDKSDNWKVHFEDTLMSGGKQTCI
jgi:succinate dehydrogenase/fumarate reductase flavoprotein subunit